MCWSKALLCSWYGRDGDLLGYDEEDKKQFHLLMQRAQVSSEAKDRRNSSLKLRWLNRSGLRDSNTPYEDRTNHEELGLLLMLIILRRL
jgi:hypothetical protein